MSFKFRVTADEKKRTVESDSLENIEVHSKLKKLRWSWPDLSELTDLYLARKVERRRGRGRGRKRIVFLERDYSTEQKRSDA